MRFSRVCTVSPMSEYRVMLKRETIFPKATRMIHRVQRPIHHQLLPLRKAASRQKQMTHPPLLPLRQARLRSRRLRLKPKQRRHSGALLINGDTAYEYYNFVRGTADLYTSAINRAGTLLAGKTNVYDMIVPTSMGITAPDNVVATINTSDQKKAINYMYSGMGKSGVKTVSIYDTLKARRNEYIFFRTDHHWTALGAYYAYCDFIKATGGTPAALDSFIVHQFPNYLGSFYTSSKKLPQLAANPDTVFAYQPKETNSMQIYFSVGGPAKTEPIISDMTNVSSKYLTFIKGDRPFSIINNPAKNDGSVCVLVKESFGNAFAPLLVPNYQTVYIIDYRYFSGTVFGGKTYNSIPQLCIDVKAKDLLFLNNISATRNKGLVNSINALIK